ncbi:MAG: phospholipase D-like domain-containing protein [Bdellovibrionota bacterium]
MKNLKNKFNIGLVCLTLTQMISQAALAKPFYLANLSLEDSKVQETKQAVKKSLPKVAPEKIEKIAAYLVSIGLTPEKTNFKFQLTRILNSSTQFLFCEDVEDWACLEAKAEVAPKSKMRQDVLDNLGKPVYAGDKLELEYFFTQGWHNNYAGKTEKNFVIPDKTVAEIMADKIQSEGEKRMFMAIYGIDDIQDTMSSVFNAIAKKVKAGIATYAVIDVSDEAQTNSFLRDYNMQKMPDGRYALGDKKVELDFSYIASSDSPNAAFTAPGWAEKYLKDVAELSKTMSKFELRKYLLDDYFIKPPATTKAYDLQAQDLTWIALNKNLTNYKENLSRMAFQYANNLQLIRLINQNVKENDKALARVEYPFTGIMHNKFIVFEKNSGLRSVWTGTTNVSRTCMGDESNSNLAILIKNDAIAGSFLEEFKEMFQGPNDSASKPKSLVTGAYHDKKRPNTQRYFTFTDGTEARVHFSPTDDGEHRVLLPLVYSARKGDLLRISMFGGGGYEMVRAMQSAAARGVEIRIVFDKLTGAGANSWWKAKDGNLLEQNPYAKNPKGSVEVRKNNWSGLNHHKSATLSRRQADGSLRAEIIVVGSQNWSQTGNDINDENMLTVRNKTKELDVMRAFNQEFDQKMWPSSSKVGQTADAGPVAGEE